MLPETAIWSKPNLHTKHLVILTDNSYKELSVRLSLMLFDHTIKGSVYVTSRVSCRMSILIRAGQEEPNAAWSVMSLVIHWQAITAGWMNGSYHHIINTDQCTCLSSNTISLSTQLSSVRCMSCLMSTNRKLKCLLWLVLPSWPVWPLRLF